MTTSKARPTVRRNFLCYADLAGWMAWYSAVSGRQLADIFNEALREWYDRHKGDYPDLPNIMPTAPDISDQDKRRKG